MADRHRHGPANTKGREFHDQSGKLEHHFGKALEEVEHRFLWLARNLCQRNGENHREHDDL
jgi:hypothetical protein